MPLCVTRSLDPSVRGNGNEVDPALNAFAIAFNCEMTPTGD